MAEPNDITAESWRTVPGFDDYSVSTRGRVRRDRAANGTQAGRILVPGLPTARGHVYLQLTLRRGGRRHTVAIHRLVAAAFLGPKPAGMHIDHRNGVTTDNRVENLEYVTPRENTARAHAMGLVNVSRGEHRYNAKLTDDDVRAIRALRASGHTCRALSARFGVVPGSICRIARGEIWRHVV